MLKNHKLIIIIIWIRFFSRILNRYTDINMVKKRKYDRNDDESDKSIISGLKNVSRTLEVQDVQIEDPPSQK